MFAVEMHGVEINVKLYWMKNENEDENEGKVILTLTKLWFLLMQFLIDQNLDLSELILDLLERAFQIFGAELDDDKITGETINLPVKSYQDTIPSLLQIAESIVFGVDDSQSDSISQIRHKILDRLISIYLM